MAYFLYVRKSEEDEGRQVQSIGDQKALGLQLARDRGFSIIETVEESRSAKRPGRPVFNEMIRRIEAGEAQGIIAWHPDRLARNAVDAGLLIDLLDRGRLRDLKFGSYTFENSPEGKWMLGIVLGQSKYFVDKLSKDVRRGMRSKLEKGHYPHRALPGYRNDVETRTIVPDPERFDLVQRAFKLVLSGAYSPPEVLDILNRQWGFRTRKTPKSGGGPLSRTTFYDMLSSPFYAGLLEHDGQTFPGAHPPMLTNREFGDLQRLLNRCKVTVRQKKEFDFTGLMRCGRCGCTVTAEAKTKHYKGTGRTRTYVYYHCTNGKGGCSKHGISQEAIEAQVASLLDRVTIHAAIAKWCLEPARQWHEQKSGLNHAALDTLRQALSGAERKKSNLLNALLSDPDLFSAEEFKEQKERLQSEISRLKAQIAEAEELLEQVGRTVENVFDFAVNARRRFQEGDARLRREISRQLGVNYCLTLGTLEIEPHPLLLPIIGIEPAKKSFQSTKRGPVGAIDPAWCPIPDEVRTLARCLSLAFPKMQWARLGFG
jgi:DNA invertase Pin-like site-specific DNA recombinase/predicted DNA-binding protein